MKGMIKAILATIFFNVLFFTAFPISKGSETVVSVEPYYMFPVGDSTNTLLAFGFFKDGFGLRDTLTTCTFKSIFPVSGKVHLKGGQLSLRSDFILNNQASLHSAGVILGNDYIFDFAESVTGIPAFNQTTFKDVTVFTSADFHIGGTVTFLGDCVLDGRFNEFVLDRGAVLRIGKNSKLALRNMEVQGIGGRNICCVDNSGTLILDNMRWIQNDDFSFEKGSLSFLNSVEFSGPYFFRP